MTVGLALLLSFLVLLAVGVPVSISMGISTLIAMVLGGYTVKALALMTSRGVDSFLLLAIPFFILAGNLMNSTGITRRIFDFSEAVVGHVSGGLAQVNVLASMIFSGISGTAVGDAAGLGIIEMKAMTERGYGKPFSAAVTLASSVVGPIIPPSVPFVVYAFLAQVSIAKLFVAGLVPGVLIGLTLMITNYYLVRSGRVVCPPPQPFRWSEVWRSLRGGFFALIAPLVILWGMLGGVVTPTEAGLLAVVYAVFVGVVYRELKWADLSQVVRDSLYSTATIMFLIGVGTAMGWVVAAERLPVVLSGALLSMTQNKYVMLMIINILLLVLGLVMEGIPIKLILLPILLPILDSLGIDRLHFGVVMTYNLLIGLATPPVGLGLFVMSSVTRLSIDRLVRAVVPFYIPMIIALLVLTYVPALTLWLPNLLMPDM